RDYLVSPNKSSSYPRASAPVPPLPTNFASPPHHSPLPPAQPVRRQRCSIRVVVHLNDLPDSWGPVPLHHQCRACPIPPRCAREKVSSLHHHAHAPTSNPTPHAHQRLVGDHCERCLYCHGLHITREGKRYKKHETVQLWRCQDCNRVFTPQIAKGKTFPLAVILA